ncbi:MAG: VWA domain-containing protein [Spirochaetales bacterium]|nr:VWA domain-containing protein [Spirochaetales bacterium]
MKTILVPVFLVIIALAAAASPLDFVVLLDISESMLPYFDDTVNYLIRDILKEHLVPSDGFHLLTFADNPGIELMLDLESGDAIDDALNRILLLQPLGSYTDLVSALRFVYSYTKGLRQQSEKKILVLTDGIHDPPPGSPYAIGGDIYARTATEVAREMRKEGWHITLVQFPALKVPAFLETEGTDAGTTSAADTLPGAETAAITRGGATTAAETPAVEDERITGANAEADTASEPVDEKTVDDTYAALAKDLDVDVLVYGQPDGDTTHRVLGAPELVFPENLGRVGRVFTMPLTVRNLSDDRILVELEGLIWNGADLLDSPVILSVRPQKSRELRAKIRIPSSVESGPVTLDLEAVFGDDLRIYPRKGSVTITLKGDGLRDAARSVHLLPVLGYAGAIAGGIVLLILLTFAARSLLARAFATAGTSAAQAVYGTADDRAIEMYVEGQNPHIGNRNVHYIRKDGSATVGGGFSSFLIYLYKFPPRIGLLSRKGDRYAFLPVKPEFFEDAEAVDDCLDKDIAVVSSTGRRLTIRFRRYISALEQINAIMRLVRKPEKDEE